MALFSGAVTLRAVWRDPGERGWTWGEGMARVSAGSLRGSRGVQVLREALLLRVSKQFPQVTWEMATGRDLSST